MDFFFLVALNILVVVLFVRPNKLEGFACTHRAVVM